LNILRTTTLRDLEWTYTDSIQFRDKVAEMNKWQAGRFRDDDANVSPDTRIGTPVALKKGSTTEASRLARAYAT
jgi:hypothetical protein